METLRYGRVAKLQLVEKRALLVEPLGRKSARWALARRRVGIEVMFVDRGLDRWRSHDTAAERQKRTDMAERRVHTLTTTDHSQQQEADRRGQLRLRSDHVTRRHRTPLCGRGFRGADAGAGQRWMRSRMLALRAWARRGVQINLSSGSSNPARLILSSPTFALPPSAVRPSCFSSFPASWIERNVAATCGPHFIRPFVTPSYTTMHLQTRD